MKLTVISDIHANLEAFYEALQFIHREGTDEIYILGDIVGYGANPDECTSLTDYLIGGRDNPGFEIEVETGFLDLKECNVRVLAGNHDCAVVDRLPLSYFNVEARKALVWTRKRLSEKNRIFLNGLPLIINEGELQFVHGSPQNPEKFSYIINNRDAQIAIDNTSARVVFVGHSHVPDIYRFNLPPTRTDERRFEDTINDDEQALINVGSVGQPRDSDPRLSVCFYDTDTGDVRIERIEYDFETTQEKIKKQRGIPDKYAERLRWGL